MQQQRERDQAAEAEKKEADEKLFEKQWNTDDRLVLGGNYYLRRVDGA